MSITLAPKLSSVSTTSSSSGTQSWSGYGGVEGPGGGCCSASLPPQGLCSYAFFRELFRELKVRRTSRSRFRFLLFFQLQNLAQLSRGRFDFGAPKSSPSLNSIRKPQLREIVVLRGCCCPSRTRNQRPSQT